MVKRFFFILITIILSILLSSCQILFLRADKNTILDFIKKYPDKSAIKLVRNDINIVDLNSNIMMPLASTVKIIIAVEYAEQANSGDLDPNEEISLFELDDFYVEDSDGGAHKFWLDSIKSKIKDNKISIKEIAKGMIKYSSNANTEWLSKKLGLEKINNRIKSLGIKNHSEIYYIVSSLFVGKEKYPNVKGKDLELKLKELNQNDYIELINKIHNKLITDKNYKNELDNVDTGLNIQKVWSNRLPSSTTSDYLELMKKINSRTYFSLNTQKYLDEVMEWIFDDLENKNIFEHIGIKGGSTVFVLTKALYARDKSGNKTELVYFFNNLTEKENIELQTSMNEFELSILTDESFIKKIENVLRK